MKQVPYYCCVVVLLALQSCDQSLPRTDLASNSISLPQIAGSTPVMAELPGNKPMVAPTSTKLNPAHGQPGHRCDIAVGAPLTSTPAFQTTLPASAVSGQPNLNIPRNPALPANQVPAVLPNLNAGAAIPNNLPVNASNAGNSALNPAHGLPNHRCDIPVGAPLNSPPGKTVNIANQQTTAPVVAKGMNPKHGEPGHRCDIPVGAPLNSPLRKTNNVVTANPSVPVPPVATATAVAATKFDPLAGNAPADGLNPKHGEPGHRCDIAVGAPLTSKKE